MDTKMQVSWHPYSVYDLYLLVDTVLEIAMKE